MWDVLVLRSKFVKLLTSVLKWKVNFISNFVSFFIAIRHNSPLSFTLIHFLLSMKESNESPNFENFWCSGESLPNSLCHFPNHKLAFVQISHHTLVAWNIASLYIFSSNIIYFGQKQSIKANIFETFKFSCQNSSNSSCQFWKDKSIPLQIVHHSPVSLLVTSL